MYEAFLSAQLVAEAALEVRRRAEDLEPYEAAVERRIAPLLRAGWGRSAVRALPAGRTRSHGCPSRSARSRSLVDDPGPLRGARIEGVAIRALHRVSARPEQTFSRSCR
jgi:hypothetical protein